VADDPDHTLPGFTHWGPACSGWSVDFGDGNAQVACPAICLAPNNQAPPVAPGHVDAAIVHKYGAPGAYHVVVRYVLRCGEKEFDPTISAGTADANVAVT
jgi:hypothetical protein